MPYPRIRLLFSIIFVFILSVNNIYSEELIIKGVYLGKNLYIKNPFSPNGVGFCISSVTINGNISHDEINSSAFEIDLSAYDLKIGEPITIVIVHKSKCKPLVLNIEVIKPKSTFQIQKISYDKTSKLLKWTSSNENGSLPYIVEQFKWKKWVKVGEVEGIGTKGTHSYYYKIEPHSGKNRFRVKQVDFYKKPNYSPEVTYRSLSPMVKFSPAKPRTEIKFSTTTNYEIYNFYGQLVKKGRSRVVNISKLKKGNYFLNYDNTTDQFYKK